MKKLLSGRLVFILSSALLIAACEPDLYVESFALSPQCPSTTDQITFTAKIKNKGNDDAVPSVMSFRIGGETYPPTYPVPLLGPGDSHVVTRSLMLGVIQNYQNTINVDINNDVDEMFELNNEKKLFYSVVTPGDRVCIVNGSGNENAVLVDGNFAAGYQNDNTFISTDSAIPVGSVSSGVHNEVIAFTNHRPVALVENANWSNSNNDHVAVPFRNVISIPVKVWIVEGPFNAQRQDALDAYATTLSIWDDERMGVTFKSFEIVDATGDADASTYSDFTCADENNIKQDIGNTAGMINIYYVDTVDGGTGRGNACAIGSDFVAMGSGTGDELLVHEIGHDFALTHINDLASFNTTNVMHSASNTREFLTEGQTFRAHLRAGSAINSIYDARKNLVTRNCARDTVSNTCPRINKRIWADGVFPAN